MHIIKKLNALLAKRDKQFLYVLFIFSIFIAVMETVGVSIIMPFISVASDFSIANSNGEQWAAYKNFEGSLIRWTSVDLYDKAMNWNIVILSPIIWTALLGLSGTFLSLKKEKL